MNRFVLFVAFALLFCAPLLPSSDALAPAACASAAVAKQEARTRLLAYAKLKQRKNMYCGKARNAGRWGWIDNGSMISISVTAIRNPAANLCYYMLTHSAADANIFFGTRNAPGAPYSDADFQVNLKRAKGYRAMGQPVNWHHGEVVAARFLAQYEAAAGDITVYPAAAKADVLALPPKLSANGGAFEVVGVYPDRPFCTKCAGTDAAYNGVAAVSAGKLMPIGKPAVCTATNAALGKIAAVTTADNQITAAETDNLNTDAKAYRVGLNEGLCCDWEAKGKAGPDPANCYPAAPEPMQDEESDPEDEEDEGICKKRKSTCDAQTGARKKEKPTKAFLFKARRLAKALESINP